MTLDEVKAFMQQAGWGTLATSDGQTVGVRPMGGWAWFEGELWCATGAASEKVAQLRRVPYAEYCFADRDGKHVRIAGPCTVSTDNADKQRLYDAVPAIRDHVESATSPGYAVLRLRPERVRAMVDALAYEDVPTR